MSEYLISTNPAKSYEEIGRIPVSTLDQIKSAVAAARKALPSWKALSTEKRASYIKKIASLLSSQLDEIAALQTKEMGKPISESIGECKGIIYWLNWQADNAPRILAQRVLDKMDTHQTELHFEPYGVAAVIAPWNYPSYQMFLGVTQALLAGNTVVFKHSEECSLTAELIASIIADSEIPSGVFNIIYGEGEVGKQLLDQEINLIHFTGSSLVGEQVYKKAAEKFIPVVLEMGGSSPAIVYKDVDITKVAKSVYDERFSNCGQICCALKRLIVHESIYDELTSKLKEVISSQVIGDPLAKDTTLGPLVAKRQLMLLEKQVKDAIDKGAVIETGGERPDNLDGAFYKPTLLTNVSKDMSVITDEVFGPVLPMMKFSTEKEAIELANDTPYGLSAFIYTNDNDLAERTAKELEAGQVSINGALYFSDHSPFGGYKKSGIGRGDGELGFHNVAQAKVIAKPV